MSQKKNNKHKIQKKKESEKSIASLLAKIEEIEKKLDLISVIGKAMPIIIISTVFVIASFSYLWTHADRSLNTNILPITGDKVSKIDLLISGNLKNLQTPTTATIIDTNLLTNDRDVVISGFLQDQSGSITEIKDIIPTKHDGEFNLKIPKLQNGDYILWVEISNDNEKIAVSNFLNFTINEKN